MEQEDLPWKPEGKRRQAFADSKRCAASKTAAMLKEIEQWLIKSLTKALSPPIVQTELKPYFLESRR